MKAIFIAFDQAYYDRIVENLNKMGCRGFTAWEQVLGRGSKTGEPHYGSHAWPSMCSAMLVMAPADRVQRVLDYLHEQDALTPKLGLRAFVWDITQAI